MTYSLYLDDERTPRGKAPYGEWVICRSVRDAIECIALNGWPYYLSLDHDLGENEPTGYDFVKWLVNDWEMLRPEKSASGFPECNYHTANPVGRDNMKAYIDNYLRHLASESL